MNKKIMAIMINNLPLYKLSLNYYDQLFSNLPVFVVKVIL
ncbi:hypothetical protein MuYL_1704 [Mucilaginibacter xinganensis]|uniref:Uncharacterized protein n=1 Tax=Mucilaginibacter xinganensis TaxID=1234841 RepID=A0A223NV13_9SPHI|nr:hypothetical protein MuYL_1704 [Mucilaginibacter xinganensis]